MPEIIPPYLKAGDKVGIVAPAGRIDKESIQPALEKISSWGLEVITGDNIYNGFGYFSGTDQERLDDLQKMLDDPQITAIFCLRGGYGITRIVDFIQLNNFINHPKWVIGFSDITALHNKLALNKIQSVHGIMPSLFIPEKANPSIENLRKFLFGEINSLEWSYHPSNIEGSANGILKGGNLSILADGIGTSTEVDTENTILFLEEVDEYLYKIDRMLTHLERAQWFTKISGLIIGHFTSIKDTNTPFGKTLEEIILEKARHLEIPVAFGLPCGHDYPNFALPHNRPVKLNVNSTNSILQF